MTMRCTQRTPEQWLRWYHTADSRLGVPAYDPVLAFGRRPLQQCANMVGPKRKCGHRTRFWSPDDGLDYCAKCKSRWRYKAGLMLKGDVPRAPDSKNNSQRSLELICDVGWAVAQCEENWGFRAFAARVLGGFSVRELASRAQVKWASAPGAPRVWNPSLVHRLSEEGRRVFAYQLLRAGLVVDGYTLEDFDVRGAR